MEINKQLFEDVLSGKLKGTFVLRRSTAFNSKCLKRTENTFLCHNPSYPYALISNKGNEISFASSYTENGIWRKLWISSNDIVDFIPDTDMKENELTIEIPDEKIVDWDESKKQNKIVLKNKQLTYRDICEKLFKDKVCFTTVRGNIKTGYTSGITDPNNAKTEHQLECLLAKNMLANVAKYLNDGWKPDKNASGHFNAWVLFMTPDKDYIGSTRIIYCSSNSNVLFKSKELAQQAIEILGEETIKLALEPLGV